MARSQHARIDAEAHVLRLLALARVGSDAHRKHEIVDEDTIGALVLARFGRIGTRCQQPVVDLRGLCLVMRQRLRVAGNQPADLVDAWMTGVSRAQTPAAKDVGSEQQKARDIGRLERASEPREQTFRARCFDETRESRYIDHIQQTAFVRARRVQQHASEARVSHQGDEVRIEAFIGENHAENLDAVRKLPQRLDAAPPSSRLVARPTST